MLPRLPPRSPSGHKRTFGHVLIVGGSVSMPGAAALTGLGALRSGAGLVTIATSREAQPITAGFSPALMTVPLSSRLGLIESTPEELEPLLVKADCLAAGPGLGQSPALQSLLSRLYRDFPGAMVIDADGLNNLAAARTEWSQHAGPRILTPHPGEYRRLHSQPNSAPGEQPHDSPEALAFATCFARDNRLVLLLKGPATLVTDGTEAVFNRTGNSGLATAGSGDVLTGVIAALWAGWICHARSSAKTAASVDFVKEHPGTLAADGSGLLTGAFCAAVTGAYLHGLAGELAARDRTETALISSDLPAYLGPAIRELGGR